MLRNLVVLNIVEILERFAYYGVRTLLILFLIKGLHISRAEAIETYGTFTAIILLVPFAGGILADGTRRPALLALIGCSISTASIFLLAFSPSIELAKLSLYDAPYS